MKYPLTSAANLGLLAILVCFGCSKAPLLPEKLAQQVAGADRVVLVDLNAPSTSLEFSGPEALVLLRAASESKGVRMDKNWVPSCPGGVYLQFFRGTNLLAQVHGHDNHFIFDEVGYTDWSGALQSAWDKVHEKQLDAIQPKN